MKSLPIPGHITNGTVASCISTERLTNSNRANNHHNFMSIKVELRKLELIKIMHSLFFLVFQIPAFNCKMIKVRYNKY